MQVQNGKTEYKEKTKENKKRRKKINPKTRY